MNDKRYWHLFAKHDPETDLYVHVILGNVTQDADAEITNQKTGEARKLKDQTYPVNFLDEPLHLTYVTTFDHDPNEDDLDVHRPEGHRSYEQDSDGNGESDESSIDGTDHVGDL